MMQCVESMARYWTGSSAHVDTRYCVTSCEMVRSIVPVLFLVLCFVTSDTWSRCCCWSDPIDQAHCGKNSLLQMQ